MSANHYDCDTPLATEVVHAAEVSGEACTNFRDIRRSILDTCTSSQSSQCFTLLRGCTFVDGSESILHYAVKHALRGNKHHLEVIRRICAFMLDKGYDIDHTDARGQTVVELSIESRDLQLLETVVSSGASVDRRNSEGYFALHTAIRAWAVPEVYKYLLRHGADPNSSATHSEEELATTLTMPLGLVIMQLGTSIASSDMNSTMWFRIAAYLIEFNAIYTFREANLLLLHFAQGWNRTGGTPTLWEDVRPLLYGLITRGLDPMAGITNLRLLACDCKSLAHLAFFHSRSEAFGRWLIEASQSSKHGRLLTKCLLHGCRDPSTLRPNTNNLLQALTQKDPTIGGDFNAIEYVLCRDNDNTWSHKASLVNTIATLKAEHFVLRSSNRERHSAILEAVASCPYPSMKCKFAQELLRQRISSQVTGGRPDDVLQHPANRPFSTYFAELITRIEAMVNKQQSSEAMYEVLQMTLDYKGHSQKNILGCFVHVVTVSAIRSAENGSSMSKSRFYYLLRLRKEFELPEIHIPNAMVLDMLKGASEAYAKLKDLEKFFTHDDTVNTV